MLNVYKIQYDFLNNNMYYSIDYCILNLQHNIIYKNNITFNIYNKKDYFYNNKNNNWYIYPYYISAIFLTNEPKELIPYIKWKIQNIKQRV